MKVEHINLFLKATTSVFDTMLSCQPKRLEARLGDAAGSDQGITAKIEFAGPARGSLALTMPDKTGITAANRLLGGLRTSLNDEAKDVIIELVNMIAVNAKSTFSGDPPLELGKPSIVRGESCGPRATTRAPSIEIPYASEVGRFNLRVTFEPE